MNPVVRLLIGSGLLLVAAGVAVYAFQRLGGSGFRMPGDIAVQRKNFTFYFPVVTCVVISVVLSLIFFLYRKFFKP